MLSCAAAVSDESCCVAINRAGVLTDGAAVNNHVTAVSDEPCSCCE